MTEVKGDYMKYIFNWRQPNERDGITRKWLVISTMKKVVG